MNQPTTEAEFAARARVLRAAAELVRVTDGGDDLAARGAKRAEQVPALGELRDALAAGVR